MIKQMTFAVLALVCFASQGFARHPFVSDPIADTPSVLVKAQAPTDAAAAAVGDAAAAADATAAAVAEVGADAVVASPEPAVEGAVAAEDGSVISDAGVVPATESDVVYRTVRPSRRSSKGFVGELIELERRKNAWIRKNIFGR